jgi:hypothetical protein
MSEVKRYSPREISDAYTNTFRDIPLTAPLCDYVAAGAYAALARDLAACKIARDGWIKASDEAHARIRELEEIETGLRDALRDLMQGRHLSLWAIQYFEFEASKNRGDEHG